MMANVANQKKVVKIVDLSTVDADTRERMRMIRLEGGVLMDVTNRSPLSGQELESLENARYVKNVTGVDPMVVMALVRRDAGTIHDATGEDMAATKARAAKAGGIVESSSIKEGDRHKRDGILRDVSNFVHEKLVEAGVLQR